MTMKISVLLSLLLSGCMSLYPKNTTVGICWDTQGRAHYPEGKYNTAADADNPHCKSEKFVWAKKVKTVHFNPGEYEEYRDSFVAAIDFWNQEMGQQVFAIVNTSMGADITVEFATFEKPFGSEHNAGASTRHTRYGNEMTSAITLKSFGDSRQIYLYIAHELGHAGFGLAHDPNGIMYPFIADREGTVLDKQQMLYWPVLSNDKVAILAMVR